ncbi:hypothetical protein Dimus_029165 [Dionaea muscipula]
MLLPPVTGIPLGLQPIDGLVQGPMVSTVRVHPVVGGEQTGKPCGVELWLDESVAAGASGRIVDGVETEDAGYAPPSAGGGGGGNDDAGLLQSELLAGLDGREPPVGARKSQNRLVDGGGFVIPPVAAADGDGGMERVGSGASVLAGRADAGGGRVDTGGSEVARDQVGRVASRFTPLAEFDESAAEDDGCCIGDSDLEGHWIATSCVVGLFDTIVDIGEGGRCSQTEKQHGRGRGRQRGRGGTRGRGRS